MKFYAGTPVKALLAAAQQIVRNTFAQRAANGGSDPSSQRAQRSKKISIGIEKFERE